MVPPQAYTRDVLIKAFEWLNSQPASIRERATSADALVGLFMQAKRKTTEGAQLNWDQPTAASVEAFKSDLKNLAEGLRQFEDPFAPPPTSTPKPSPSAAPRPEPSVTTWPAFDDEDADLQSLTAQATTSSSPGRPIGAPAAGTLATRRPVDENSPFALDAKSRIWVQEVQRRLNLSSEQDAMRALIAIGYERLRELLPRA